MPSKQHERYYTLNQAARAGDGLESITIRDTERFYHVIEIEDDGKDIVFHMEDREPRYFERNGIRPALTYSDLFKATVGKKGKVKAWVQKPGNDQRFALNRNSYGYHIPLHHGPTDFKGRCFDFNRRNGLRIHENQFQSFLHMAHDQRDECCHVSQVPSVIHTVCLSSRYRPLGNNSEVLPSHVPLAYHLQQDDQHVLLFNQAIMHYEETARALINRLFQVFQIGKCDRDENTPGLFNLVLPTYSEDPIQALMYKPDDAIQVHFDDHYVVHHVYQGEKASLSQARDLLSSRELNHGHFRVNMAHTLSNLFYKPSSQRAQS